MTFRRSINQYNCALIRLGEIHTSSDAEPKPDRFPCEYVLELLGKECLGKAVVTGYHPADGFPIIEIADNDRLVPTCLRNFQQALDEHYPNIAVTPPLLDPNTPW